MTDRGERFEHPAYGMISFSRVQGGGTRLHNSDIRHQSYIHLIISKSSLTRDLHSDWHGSGEELVEVWLSPVQLSEALFNMNSTGVPCTLRRYRDATGLVTADVETMPDFNLVTQFKKEANETLANSLAQLDEISKKLEKMVNSKTTKKSDIKELKFKAEIAVSHLKANIPFVEKCFAESMENRTMMAKAEIEAYLESKIRSVGLEALQGEARKMLEGPTKEQS